MKIKEKGISTLVLVFIIASLLAMIIFVLHPISLLSARRANQLRYSQTAFFAAEGALYETIQHLRDNTDLNWPDFSSGEDTLSYTIGEGDNQAIIRRAIRDLGEGQIEIDITATIKGRKRRVVAIFGAEQVPETENVDADIMLVLDVSGSMNRNSKLVNAKEAILTFIGEEVGFDPAYHWIGFTKFSATIFTPRAVPLTNDYAEIRNEVNNTTANDTTCTACGIKDASEEFVSNSRPEAEKFMIVISDGMANTTLDGTFDDSAAGREAAKQDTIEQADLAKSEGTVIFAIAYGSSGDAALTGLMGDIASESETGEKYYFNAPSGEDLKAILTLLGVTIKEGISESFEYQEEIPEPD